MDTRFWGPCGWVLLHGIVNNYSNIKISDKREKYKVFFNSLPSILPCIYCRRSLSQYYKELPLTNDILDNKTKLCKWLFNIHNKVNDKLRNQGLNDKVDPSFQNVCRQVCKRDYCKINKCWNFLYSIAMNYPTNEIDIPIDIKIQYHNFYYYFIFLFPNKKISDKMLDYNKINGLYNNLNNKKNLLKWLYGIEKILSDDCLCYKKRIEKTEKYIAGCKGIKDEKPTCRVDT